METCYHVLGCQLPPNKCNWIFSAGYKDFRTLCCKRRYQASQKTSYWWIFRLFQMCLVELMLKWITCREIIDASLITTSHWTWWIWEWLFMKILTQIAKFTSRNIVPMWVPTRLSYSSHWSLCVSIDLFLHAMHTRLFISFNYYIFPANSCWRMRKL